jgi:hypothetical protein
MSLMTDRPTSGTPAIATPAAPPANDVVPARPPPEPFGQTGIRQYILPTLATIFFTLACSAAIMWVRSRSTADIFARRDGAVTWSVRSLYSRIVITRIDLNDPETDDVPGIPLGGGGWQYVSFEFPDGLPDGWEQSWRKTLGVEWRPESLARHPSIVGGWWMRIQWRTVTLVAMTPPIVIAVLHDLRQRRRKQRAAAAIAVVDDTAETPAAS